MHAALVQPCLSASPADTAPRPLLAAEGARIVLGLGDGALTAPVKLAPNTLLGPRGAALAGRLGPLFVCDTGHHRLLVWRMAPQEDGAPADFVFGQPDFVSKGRNAEREIGPNTLAVPTGITVGCGVLAVADTWNHRVLIWHGMPLSPRQTPDIVLGQADFTSGLANRGRDKPAADTLNRCYGVAIRGGRLIVADTGNRRLLVWNTLPQINGAPADIVLGQRDFWTRDAGGGPVDASGMRWPHAASVDGGRLFVSDAGTSRVMVWHHIPDGNGAPCDVMLGQADFTGADHNRGATDPTGASLHMPYGVAAMPGRLVVADTANSRLLGFDLAELRMGIAADRLAGQHDFRDKGENRRERPVRDTLCWPHGVSMCGDTALIADTGNNRVLLWDIA